LTPDEQLVLAPYIFGRETTQNFHLENGVVGGLVAKGILYHASRMGHLRTGFAFNLHDWARDYLTANQHLLLEALLEAEKRNG
jgi:hypothetical protein